MPVIKFEYSPAEKTNDVMASYVTLIELSSGSELGEEAPALKIFFANDQKEISEWAACLKTFADHSHMDGNNAYNTKVTYKDNWIQFQGNILHTLPRLLNRKILLKKHCDAMQKNTEAKECLDLS